MKKIILLIVTVMLFVLSVQAKSEKIDFPAIIKASGIDKNSIAVSIRDSKTGDVVYSLNDKISMNPASVQKVLTMTAAADMLGKDYKFSTGLYSNGENSYLIKLSADPYLKYEDLKILTKSVKRDTQNIYIDDNILDSKIWGEGWQWDDDMNILMPKFGSYNLDKNLIKLNIIPSETGQYAQIINPSKYPLVLMNNITTSNKTSINIKRKPEISDNAILLNGTIARQTTVYIPTNNMKRYFENQLTRALGENKVYLKNPFYFKKYSSSDTQVSIVEHDLQYALGDILKNSNNMSAETVFKLAGGKYSGNTGTAEDGIRMFNDFCKKLKIDYSEIKITDGSGTSKNNLVTADFVTSFLYANKDNYVMEYLPKPGEGTLTQRMLPIKDNLKAKTGTLSDISSLAGFLTAKNGHKYVFCIIQTGGKLSSSEKKELEDYIIREAYLKL